MVAALAACGSASESPTDNLRAALESWRAGADALGQGDAEAARRHFQEARRRRPEDAVLLAWQARAESELGFHQVAVELLDHALILRPEFSEARYNRAAYLARMGHAEAAGEELERALDAGSWTVREVASDADFEPYLGHPAFAFLPTEAVAAAWTAADHHSVFQGNTFSLSAHVFGAGEHPIGVTAERLEGPIVLTGAREAMLDSTDGKVRELTWTWRALGPGLAEVGPLVVTANGRSTTLREVDVRLLAPPDAVAPEVVHLSRLPTPLEFAAGERPRASSLAGDLVVVHEHGDRVEVSPRPESEPHTLVYLERQAPVYRVLRWEGGGDTPRRIRVERRGATLLDTTLAPGSLEPGK